MNDLAQSHRLAPENAWYAILLAVTLVESNDHSAYRSLCREMLERFGASDGETAYLDFSGSMPGAAYTAPGADEVYLHVSIDQRELSVRQGSRVLHRFPVAVGKGAYLRHRDAENGGWLFETPAGVFSVGRKEENPVWYAPDWHFIEKGRPVPPANSPLRYFPGDMGEYALYLGDGLAIPGSRNQSCVGQAVSHGCMRLS